MKRIFIAILLVGTALAGSILILANKEERRIDG
jgi:hypothetical protein